MPVSNLDGAQKQKQKGFLETFEKTKYWIFRNKPAKGQERSTFADIEKRLATEYVHIYMTPRDPNPYALSQDEIDELDL